MARRNDEGRYLSLFLSFSLDEMYECCCRPVFHFSFFSFFSSPFVLVGGSTISVDSSREN